MNAAAKPDSLCPEGDKTMAHPTNSGRERRAAYRYRRNDVLVSILDRGEPIADPYLSLNDLSAAGAGLQMSGRVSVGQKLRLRLDLPSGSLDCDGLVRWTEPDNMGCRVGLKLSGLGWFQCRRLRILLEPKGPDVVSLLDRLLMAATMTVILIVLAGMMGFDVDSPLAALDYIRSW